MRFIFLTVFLVGCATAKYDYSKEPDPRKSEFILGAADSIKITVWKNPELSTDAKVRPDGTITLPLLGDLRALGRTPSQVREEVAKRLAAFVKDENVAVTVAVVEVNSYRFTVSGNVEHGGVLTSKYYVTVSEALAMAGGLNKFGNHKLYILRSDEQGSRKIPIDFDRVSGGEHPNENLVVLAGDTVFVP
jgi:polysaccharide export outer membrane protein